MTQPLAACLFGFGRDKAVREGFGFLLWASRRASLMVQKEDEEGTSRCKSQGCDTDAP